MTETRLLEPPAQPHAQQLELRDERGLLLRVLYERVVAVPLRPQPLPDDAPTRLH